MSMPAPVSETPDLVIRTDERVPVVVIPAQPSFDELREWLRLVLPDALDQIGGRAGRLDLGQRELHLFDLRRLVHLLRDEFDVEITGLYVRPESVHRYAERELKLKLFTSEDPEDLTEEMAPAELAAVIEEPVGEPEPVSLRLTPVEVDPSRRTLHMRRTLRSGASVRFDGDVVVLGDVNPGAQVVAAGNVIVLGSLKGMAHAGATGAEDAFILAFELRPTQLRIGRRIAIPPDGEARPTEPEFAHLVDDQIVIDPYRTRFPR